jgi:hypothetical protein
LCTKALLFRFPETFELRDECVRARLDKVEEVSPFVVRRPGDGHARGVVRQNDGDARQRGLAFIDN